MIKRKDIKPLQGTLVAQSVEAGRASVTYTGKWSVSARGRKGAFINTRSDSRLALAAALVGQACARGRVYQRTGSARPNSGCDWTSVRLPPAAATPSPGLRPAGRSLFGPHLHDDSSGMQSCI